GSRGRFAVPLLDRLGFRQQRGAEGDGCGDGSAAGDPFALPAKRGSSAEVAGRAQADPFGDQAARRGSGRGRHAATHTRRRTDGIQQALIHGGFPPWAVYLPLRLSTGAFTRRPWPRTSAALSCWRRIKRASRASPSGAMAIVRSATAFLLRALPSWPQTM